VHIGLAIIGTPRVPYSDWVRFDSRPRCYAAVDQWGTETPAIGVQKGGLKDPCLKGR